MAICVTAFTSRVATSAFKRLLPSASRLLNHATKPSLITSPGPVRFVTTVSLESNKPCGNDCKNCQGGCGRGMATAATPLKQISNNTVSLDDTQRRLVVSWAEQNDVTEYPYVYLRDNCRCPKCLQQPSLGRLVMMDDLDIYIKPTNVEVMDDQVRVTWEGGHESDYPFDWLRDRSFTPEAWNKNEKWQARKPVYWSGKSMANNIPTDNFDAVMSDDHALYRWIVNLETVGFALLDGVGKDVEACRKLAERVAYVRATNYGVTFTVKARQSPSNAAFSSAKLGLHTDQPYYDYPPGIQMLHCVARAPMVGGESQFADGFHCANVLKERHPHHYHTLCTVPVDFWDVGTDYFKYHMHYKTPVIRFNAFGEIERIVYNDQCRCPVFPVAIDQCEAVYKALKVYYSILQENWVEFILQPGQLVTFHNYRVMHARRAFYPTEEGERHLEGIFMDWDEMRSKRRVLMQELNIDLD